ncbi:MAG: ABC transporter ATP-binding protein [Tissierellia bacterium]|nr:ABC transporter ATP-binding protein [Tissierellia bacterium]
MFNNIKKKYYLTNDEYKLLKRGMFFCTLSNLSKMLPVMVCTFILSQIFKSIKTDVNIILLNKFLIISVGIIIIMTILAYQEYNKTFIDIYREGTKRRIEIAEFLRKLPLSFFNRKEIADITTVITSDTSGIEHALAHVLPQAYGTIISSTIIFISMFILNYKLALALFWVIPFAFLIVFLSKRLQKKLGLEFKAVKVQSAEKIQSMLEMIKEIKSFSLEDYEKNEIKKQMDSFEKSQIKGELFSASILASAQMVLKLGLATVILIGSKILMANEIDLFVYIIFLFSSTLVYEPINALMNSLTEIFQTQVLVSRIKELKDEDEEQEVSNSKIDDMSIEFKNVYFSYKDSAVLNNISLKFNEGEKTALVGPSGCGKSTILKLAAGFYHPNRGVIKLGDRDISKLNSEELLKNYSVVFQDVLLFDNTIKENIRIGNKNATDEQIINASKLANCHDFIMKLPDGYETNIGEGGKLLSGGEKQRISIARAILKDAPIVLLDEITSSLDIENESLIHQAINHITKGKTVIVIAHKLDTIRDCDKIIVLKEGKVMEAGSHIELIEKNGMYKDLIEMQN